MGNFKKARVDEVLERVGLAERGQDPFRGYSLGMRQRLGIGAALLPHPELLVLDEPTNGLDPHGIAEIRTMLRSFADEGITVFVSSHLLAEIEQICEHLVVIDSGRLLFQGGVEELLAARAPGLVVRAETCDDALRLLSLVEDTGRIARMAPQAAGTMLEIDADCRWAADLNRLAMGAGITLVHLTERRSTLEEAFFDITGPAPSPERRQATPERAPVAGSAGGRPRCRDLDIAGLRERMGEDAPPPPLVRQLRRNHGRGLVDDDRDHCRCPS